MSYFAKKKKRKKNAKGKRKPRKVPRRPKQKPKQKGTVTVATSSVARKSRMKGPILYARESETDSDEPVDVCSLMCSWHISKTLNSVEEIMDYLKQIHSQIDFEVREVAHPCDLRDEAMAAMESADLSPIEDDSISEIKEEPSRRKLFFVPMKCVVSGVCENIDEMAKTKGITGFLVCEIGVRRFLPRILTRAALRKFLRVDDVSVVDCVVCCEGLCDNSAVHMKPCRSGMSCTQCGVRFCHVCVAAIALANPKLIGEHSRPSRIARFQCPQCRFDGNTIDITVVCAAIVRYDVLDEVHSEELRRKIIEKAIRSKRCRAVVCPFCCAFCNCQLNPKRLKKLRAKLMCAKCEKVTYCSTHCRNKARKQHKLDCRLWSLTRE